MCWRGWAIFEGTKERKNIESEELKKGKLLFARVLSSNRGGKIEFYQGDIKIGELETKDETLSDVELIVHGYEGVPDQIHAYNDARFNWFGVGTLASDDPITIHTEGDINVINALAAITPEEYEDATDTVTQLEYDGKILFWDRLSELEKETLFSSNSPATMTYTKISPVHYRITVDGLLHAQTVILSESYHPLWTMNGKSPERIYSLLNGFRIEQNGEYNIYFSAQRYVNIGLAISLVTLIGYGIILIKKRGNKL